MIEKLIEQCGKNRGLWLGLYCTVQGEYPGHPLTDVLPKDPHLTLAHFGKSNDAKTVYDVVHSAIAAKYNTFPLHNVEISGSGHFWHGKRATPVVLINSADLFNLRADLLAELFRRRVRYDDRYGFIPHITLPLTEEPPILARPMLVTIPTIRVVHGDEFMDT